MGSVRARIREGECALEKLGVVRAVCSELERGAAVEFVLVTGSRGASRGVGAWMAVGSRGRVAGTVGGGAAEARAERLAAELLAAGESALLRSGSEGALAAAGRACSQQRELLFVYVDACQRDTWERLASALEAREDLELAIDLGTLVDAPPREGGSGDLVRTASPLRIELDPLPGSRPGAAPGTGACHRERLCAEGFAYVIGCGHVGAALAPVLSRAGFAVVACDDRAEFLEIPALEGLDRRLVDYADLAATCAIGPRDLVVCSTASHATDFAVVGQALAAGAGYVGCMGSAKKTAAMREHLAGRGIDRSRIDELHMPVGVPIACETPDEIAISIAAEMIDYRHRGSAGRA